MGGLIHAVQNHDLACFTRKLYVNVSVKKGAVFTLSRKGCKSRSFWGRFCLTTLSGCKKTQKKRWVFIASFPCNTLPSYKKTFQIDHYFSRWSSQKFHNLLVGCCLFQWIHRYHNFILWHRDRKKYWNSYAWELEKICCLIFKWLLRFYDKKQNLLEYRWLLQQKKQPCASTTLLKF